MFHLERFTSLERPTLASESISKAYELRARASERERFYILGHYYRDVTGELNKALPVSTVERGISVRSDAANELGKHLPVLGKL